MMELDLFIRIIISNKINGHEISMVSLPTVELFTLFLKVAQLMFPTFSVLQYDEFLSRITSTALISTYSIVPVSFTSKREK